MFSSSHGKLVQLISPLQGVGARLGRASSRVPQSQQQLRPHLEVLEDRTLLDVNLLNSYLGLDRASGGYAAISGAAGQSSYIEIVQDRRDDQITIYTPKATGTTSVTARLVQFFGSGNGFGFTDYQD